MTQFYTKLENTSDLDGKTSVELGVGSGLTVTNVGGKDFLATTGTTTDLVISDDLTITSHTTAGASGDVTQNTTTGFVILPTGDATITVTNNKVVPDSVILAQIGTVDATATSIAVVPGTGSFTITANAAPTGDVNVTYLVINQ